jgi:hypothetical protein
MLGDAPPPTRVYRNYIKEWPVCKEDGGTIPVMNGLRVFLLVTAFLAYTAPAWAENTLPAGFAPGPVWVSKHAPVSGEKVFLYAAIYNASETPIEGSITFSVDGTSVGSVPFALDDGETSIKSVSWTATEGSHTVDAVVGTAIEKQSKQATSVRSHTTGEVTISVAPPAPQSVAVEHIDSASAAVSTVLASSSPIVASIANTVISATESIRTTGETLLTKASTEARAPTNKGQVLSAEIEHADTTSAKNGLKATIARTLLPIFTYPALFYPLFFLILLVAFWAVAKRLRSPKRRGR